jgi:hypothetical protein
MKRQSLFAASILHSLVLVTAFSSTALADITIGGVTFADNAFADVVLDASPSGSGQFLKEIAGGSQTITLPADFAILQAAVVGPDVSEWISLRTSQAHLTVGFTDLIPINGPGADIAIVEIGVTAAVAVTIEGVTQQMHSQAVGSVNMIFIDLSDFGVAQTSSVTVSSSDIFNDIAAFGVINGVPEPSSIVLGALGLIGLAAWGWRRKR